jgi:hypothetical protein
LHPIPAIGDVQAVIRSIVLFALCTALPALAAGGGTLKIETDPSGAAVVIDGQEVGKTPFNKKLEANTYWITLRKSGFEDATPTVELGANKTVSISEKLKASAEPVEQDECQPNVLWDPNDVKSPAQDTKWFKVPKGTKVTVEAYYASTLDGGVVVIYMDGGRAKVFDNPIEKARRAISISDSHCFAVTAFWSDYRYKMRNAQMHEADATWPDGFPGGKGLRQMRFKGRGFAGTVSVVIE